MFKSKDNHITPSDGATSTANENNNIEAENKKEDDSEIQERGGWGGQLEFILTCVGYAVGLGNVWRFPYLCFKNGGGAFLVPYIIMLICCGLPVFCFEICLGQFGSLGPLTIWAANPIFKGIGISMVLVSCCIGLYYNILMSYIIYFFFASMTSRLPWTDCENGWNSDFCLTSEEVQNKTYLAWYLESNNMTNKDIKTPSEEYFYNEVLQISPSIDEMGGVRWQLALCLLLAWIVVFLVLLKGIKSLGKVVYFTSTFPYLMMTVMVIRGGTLEGAAKGLEYYIKPDFSKLGNSEVWSDAATQIFYSLSTCSGGLIAMSSYNKFNNNVFRDAYLVPVINCITSIYAGIAIFSVLGYMAHIKNVDVADVAQSGPGLVFVVYPEGLSRMPAPPVWAVLFFFMMLTLGFSSQFSIVECVFVALIDQFPSVLRRGNIRPVILRGVCIIIFYLLSLPMVTKGGFFLFNIADSYAGGFPRLFIGIFELIAITWVYGMQRFSEDIKMMTGNKPNIYFKATWVVIAPAIVTFIVIFKAIQHKPLELFGRQYPAWADILGWMMVSGIVLWIPIWMVIQLLLDGGWGIVKKSASPKTSWGPTLKENKTGRYAEDYNQEETQLAVITKSGSVHIPDNDAKPPEYEDSVAYDNEAYRL